MALSSARSLAASSKVSWVGPVTFKVIKPDGQPLGGAVIYVRLFTYKHGLYIPGGVHGMSWPQWGWYSDRVGGDFTTNNDGIATFPKTRVHWPGDQQAPEITFEFTGRSHLIPETNPNSMLKLIQGKTSETFRLGDSVISIPKELHYVAEPTFRL